MSKQTKVPTSAGNQSKNFISACTRAKQKNAVVGSVRGRVCAVTRAGPPTGYIRLLAVGAISVLAKQPMMGSTPTRARALDRIAPHDPRRALREAERRHARKATLAIETYNATRGTPAQTSPHRLASAAPFHSSTGRFDDPLTRHLAAQLAPGTYEQSHNTVVRLVDDKYNPFEYGNHDTGILDRAFTNAAGTDEGLEGTIAKLSGCRPSGNARWLRGDYHRWLRTQENGFHGTIMRHRNDQHRMAIASDHHSHRQHGRALQRAAYGQRTSTAIQREIVRERNHIEFELAKTQEGERANDALPRAELLRRHRSQCRMEMRSEVPEQCAEQRRPKRRSLTAGRSLEGRVAAAVAAWQQKGAYQHRRVGQECKAGEQDKLIVLFDWWCDCRSPGCLRPVKGSYADDDRCYGFSGVIANDGTDYVCCEVCFESGEARDSEKLKLIAGPVDPPEAMVELSQPVVALDQSDLALGDEDTDC